MFSLEAFQALIKKAIRSFDYKKVTLEQIEFLRTLSPQTALQVSKLFRNELTAQEVDQFFKQMDFLKPKQWDYQNLQVPFIGNFIHQALPADNDLSLTQVCVHILPRLEHQQFKEALLTVALEKISPETAVDTPENQILLQKGIQTLGENTPNRIETWIAHHMPSLATTRLKANPHVGLYGIEYQSTDYWALNLFIVAAAANASLYPYYKGHVASIRAREMDIHLLFEEHCTRILTQEQIQMEANRIVNACRLLLTDKQKDI